MLSMFFVSILLLATVWIIYPAFLKILLIKPIAKDRIDLSDTKLPNVSIIIAAHNEASNLPSRCENLFKQDYSGEIEIIIASDGSTDDSLIIIESLKKKHSSIKYIDIQPQGGRSNAHNKAVKTAKYDLLVFSDAETKFEKDFLKNVIPVFFREDVGFATGTLKYFNANSHSVNESISLYWKFEMFLRAAESKLGLYATGTGACCVVRKSMYREIPNTGDVDFITPLDVVLQGKKCIHIKNAIAWDELPDSPQKEFSARVRMTSKNIEGTLKRWGISGIIKHPVYTLSLFFHKVGRWLTPFFLIALFVSNLFLFSSDSIFLKISLLVQIIFYLLGLIGLKKINVLYSQQIYSFLLANAGFLVGVLKAIFGRTPHLYTPIAQQK